MFLFTYLLINNVKLDNHYHEIVLQ